MIIVCRAQHQQRGGKRTASNHDEIAGIRQPLALAKHLNAGNPAAA